MFDLLVALFHPHPQPVQTNDLAKVGWGQSGQSLVAFGRTQEPFEIATKAFALSPSYKEIIETLGVVLQRSGSGIDGQAFGHGGNSSLCHHWNTALILLRQT